MQIDELSGPLRSDHRSAGFEYFVQPFSLPARVVPQTTRVRVEPEYVFLVGGDEAQMRARFKFMIRGANCARWRSTCPAGKSTPSNRRT